MGKRKVIINCGAVIVKNNKILLVQEAEEPFRGKWNFPLGKIEYGEKIMGTIIRETKEETGYDVELTHFLGVYQSFSTPGLNTIIVMFRAKPIGGKLSFDKKESLQSKWFSLEEFNKLSDEELFDPEMRNVVDRALKSPRPLDNIVNF